MSRPETRGDHLDDMRCADLVMGLLPAEERTSALAHAAACPRCEAMLRAHAGATERAWSDAPARAAAKRGLARLSSPRAWWLAAAAALAVVFATPRFLAHGDHAANVLLLPAPGAEVRTREGGAQDPHLSAGLAAYVARDWATAERELLAARGEGSSETLRRLYLAQVSLARGDARAASSLLRDIDWRTVPEPWRRDGVALLARSLRSIGADVSADSIERALRTLDPALPLVP